MFKEMRRKNRSIDENEAMEILKDGQYGILSTIGENGHAYGVPLNYIYHNNALYFHCAQEGSKLDNIKHNNKVSFCVVGRTQPVPEKFSYGYESVIVFGKAVEVNDDEKLDALMEIVKKYSSNFIEEGKAYIKSSSHKTKIIKICIEHMSGKARKDF